MSLLKKFAAEENVGIAQMARNYELIADKLINAQPSIRYSTFRQYRAAFVCFFELVAAHEMSQGERAILNAALDRLRDQNGVNCSRKKQRTSSLKRKCFGEDEFEQLIRFLCGECLHWKLGFEAGQWLLLNLHFGTRPCEWFGATIEVDPADPQYYCLRLQNAKVGNLRGNGNERVLRFSKNQNELIWLAENFIKKTNSLQTQEARNKFYAGVRQSIFRANKHLWPTKKKYISLYSPRHQFSANLKKSGATIFEVAAAMGHASPRTATSHYGRKRSGRGMLHVTASADDVARVMQRSNVQSYSGFTHDESPSSAGTFGL